MSTYRIWQVTNGFTILYLCLTATMKRQKQHIAVTDLATDTVQHGASVICQANPCIAAPKFHMPLQVEWVKNDITKSEASPPLNQCQQKDHAVSELSFMDCIYFEHTSEQIRIWLWGTKFCATCT